MDERLGPWAVDPDVGLGLGSIEIGVDHLPTLTGADAQLLTCTENPQAAAS